MSKVRADISVSVDGYMENPLGEGGEGLHERFVMLDGEEPGFTWRELHSRSSRLAAALTARGLALGDRLALSLRNTPEF